MQTRTIFRKLSCSRLRFWVVFGPALLLIIFPLLGCSNSPQQITHPQPRISTGSDLNDVSGIGWLRKFSISGIALFKNRVFVGSDRGLFEIVDGKLATRFNWLERDDVVEEVFSDRVNDLLWLRHERIDKLIRYDGEAWAFVPVPAAFDTRGDRLRGFQMFNSDDALYVSSSTSLWKWDASRNAWQPVELPKLNCKGEDPGNDIRCFAGASASGRTVIAAVRHGTLAFIDALIPEKADSEQTDVLYFRDGEEWKKVPGTEDRFFFVKKLIADSGRAYLLTRSNQLFSVGPDGLSEIPSPGEVETMAASSSGTLIASVKDKGIFELTTQWEKRANTKTVGPRGLPYLAENNGRIAFGITYWDGGTTDTCNINEEVSIWVIERGSELCIE